MEYLEEDHSLHLLAHLEYLEGALNKALLFPPESLEEEQDLNKPLPLPLGFSVEVLRPQARLVFLEEDPSLRPASNQVDLPQCLELSQQPLNLHPVVLRVVPSASRQKSHQEVSRH